MHRRQHEQKFSALAFRAFQHVVQVTGQEPRPQAGNQLFHIHRLVEIAGWRVAAVKVHPVRAGQIAKGLV